MDKENNFYFMLELLRKDIDHSVSFINSLGKKKFSQVMFTNAIFALLDFIDVLDTSKLNYTILNAFNKGYDYFLSTICENSLEMSKVYYPETVGPDNQLQTIIGNNDYRLNSFDEYYNIYVGNQSSDIIGNGNMDKIKAVKYGYMGRMTLQDLPQCLDCDPSSFTHSMVPIYSIYSRTICIKNDKKFQKNVHDLFHVKQSEDINLRELYDKYRYKRPHWDSDPDLINCIN